MSWTFTTSGQAIDKAGVNANSDIVLSGQKLVLWSDQSEGRIEAETHTAWKDNYSAQSAGIKNILSDVASSLIAMKIIAYDTTGYLSREADTLLNVNDDIAIKGIAILREKENHTLRTP